jgi:hypothetical protein
MVTIISVHPIPLRITSRPDQVVDASGGVIFQRNHGLAPSAVETITLGHGHLTQDGAGMYHGEKITWVIWVKSPEVYDLLSVSVDDLDALALPNRERYGLASWEETHVGSSETRRSSIYPYRVCKAPLR